MLSDPESREYLGDVMAATREAYTLDGVAIWWRAWRNADPAHRQRMEAGVLAAWSGHPDETQNPHCPECACGKHGNCDGTAWDDDLDAPTDCDCDHGATA